MAIDVHETAHTGQPDCFCDTCLEAAARKHEIEQEAIKAYDTVSRFLNGRNAGDLVQAIARDHRTLQQAFTGVCVAWVNHLAALPEGQYDLRNAASVDLARAITKTAEWEDKSRLPYV
jgi:hypothetical protein